MSIDGGLIGEKAGMTQTFDEGGTAVPSTVIKAGPCPVVQRKTKERDGYDAVQVGYGLKKNVKKPLLGHFKKAGVNPLRVIKEFRVSPSSDLKEGKELTVELFKPGDFVDITARSKGKGFTGVMKRWGFSGGPGSHGAHKWNRRPGSIGASSTPSRVLKGMKMAGHAGMDKVTAQNLKVLKIEREENLITVRGSVPGANGGYLFITRARKRS